MNLASVIRLETSRQPNDYDCGLHVIIHVRKLLRSLFEFGASEINIMDLDAIIRATASSCTVLQSVLALREAVSARYGTFKDEEFRSFRPPRRSTASNNHVQLIGIQNEGNTCYINGGLQIIFALSSFMQDLTNVVVPPMEQHAFPGLRSSDILQDSVSHHLISLYQSLAQKNRVCSAKNIRQVLALNYNHPAYNDGGQRQHDAHEFLARLLDAIECDFIRASEKVMRLQQLPAELRSAVTAYTPMHHLACTISLEFTCGSCHFRRSRSETYNMIPFQFPPANASQSLLLESILGDYFNECELEYRCDQCPGTMRYFTPTLL